MNRNAPKIRLYKSVGTGERIRMYRTLIRWSQWDLARIVYVDQSLISQWENGVKMPSDEHKARLSEAFAAVLMKPVDLN